MRGGGEDALEDRIMNLHEQIAQQKARIDELEAAIAKHRDDVIQSDSRITSEDRDLWSTTTKQRPR